MRRRNGREETARGHGRIAFLLLERGLQVAQHTELAEQDGSGVVAVERAHLPVLKMEDIAARSVDLLPGSGESSPGHGEVTLVGSVQRQLNDDDITVEVG